MSLAAQDYTDLLELYSRATRWISEGESERWAELFTPDGIFALPAIERFDAPAMEIQGTEALEGYIREVIAGTFDAQMGLPAGIEKRYLTTNVSLEADGDGAAIGTAYFMMLIVGQDEPKILGTGVYTDRFVKTAAGWKIQRRQLTPDA
jgi:hypothetical protein